MIGYNQALWPELEQGVYIRHAIHLYGLEKDQYAMY
jgi:hypothetical protein